MKKLCLALLVFFNSSIALAENLRGALIIPPSFDSKFQAKSYKLLLSTGDRIEITPKKHLQSKFKKLAGKIVSISAKAQKKDLGFLASSIVMDDAPFSIEQAKSATDTVGFILVGFPGIAPSVSQSELLNIIENGRAPYSGSMLDIFRNSSRGIFSLAYRAADGTPNIIGPVVIEKRGAENCEKSYRAWGDRAQSAAQALGFKANRFDHIVFIFPSSETLGCSVSGRGELFGSSAWIYRVTPNSLAHEIGHNIGFYHSGRSDGQGTTKFDGDYSSPMSATNPSTVMFNAANQVQNGWLNVKDGSLLELKSGDAQDILIKPLETETLSAGEYKAIRVSPSNGSAPYIFSYRLAANPLTNNLPSEYSRGLSIHRDYGLGRTTYFVTTLKDGEHFVDVRYGIRVTQISHGNAGAKIHIAISQNSTTKLCYHYDPCSVFSRTAAAKDCSGKDLTISSPDGTYCPAEDPNADRDGNAVPDGSDPDLDYDGDGYPNSMDCSSTDPSVYRNLPYLDSDFDSVAEVAASTPVCGTDFGLNGYTALSTSDNCPSASNYMQDDDDLNGLGNACDSGNYLNNLDTKFSLLRSQLVSSSQVLQQSKDKSFVLSQANAVDGVAEILLADSQMTAYLTVPQILALQSFRSAARKAKSSKSAYKNVIKDILAAFA